MTTAQTPACRSCRWSEGMPDGERLWCQMWRRVAAQPCGGYEYEPGTDAPEWRRRDASDDRR